MSADLSVVAKKVSPSMKPYLILPYSPIKAQTLRAAWSESFYRSIYRYLNHCLRSMPILFLTSLYDSRHTLMYLLHPSHTANRVWRVNNVYLHMSRRSEHINLLKLTKVLIAWTMRFFAIRALNLDSLGC